MKEISLNCESGDCLAFTSSFERHVDYDTRQSTLKGVDLVIRCCGKQKRVNIQAISVYSGIKSRLEASDFAECCITFANWHRKSFCSYADWNNKLIGRYIKEEGQKIKQDRPTSISKTKVWHQFSIFFALHSLFSSFFRFVYKTDRYGLFTKQKIRHIKTKIVTIKLTRNKTAAEK